MQRDLGICTVIPNNCSVFTYKVVEMNILAEILSSKVRAEIFRILFGIKNPKLHLREIQRRSGFAISTVNQEAKKLSKLGLIKERKSGNRVYYRANINQPLYREIHNMVIKTIGLCDLFKEVLVDKPVIIAFIFGSTAEGKELKLVKSQLTLRSSRVLKQTYIPR